jgi:hypothetical protein
VTEYGRDRESRRRTRALLGAGQVTALAALLSLRTGWIPAVATAFGVLVLPAAVVRLVMWRDGRAERRRRAAGEAPSWPAQLPVQAALLLGAKAPGRHARRVDEVGELFGRLSLEDGTLRWTPREGDRSRGVGPLAFDRSWKTEVVSLWGPGAQGCLTLTSSGGTAVDVWIRHPADLREVLGSSR